MAYEIRLERDSGIGLEEWKRVVESTRGIRLNSDEVKAITNLKTGELITISSAEGDTQVQVEGEWVPFGRWFEGAIRFKATPTFYPPIRRILQRLAVKLSARLVGDDGEEYSRVGPWGG